MTEPTVQPSSTSAVDLTRFDRVIGLRWLQSGQKHRFGDSIYEAELTFTGRSISTRADKPLVCGSDPPEDLVKKVARLLVCNWADDAGSHGPYPYLERLALTDSSPIHSTWTVKVVVPYAD